MQVTRNSAGGSSEAGKTVFCISQTVLLDTERCSVQVTQRLHLLPLSQQCRYENSVLHLSNKFCRHTEGSCAGDTASAVVVLESAVRQYEDILGIRHPGIATLSKKAERLMEGLEPDQRSQVTSHRFLIQNMLSCDHTVGSGTP